jgi:hypothetical protein
MRNSNFINATGTMILSLVAVLTIFTGAAFADNITLDMEGTTATIPKGNTVTRRVFGVPRFSGTLKLRFKWHAVSIIPNTFNPLKVVIKHGSSVLNSRNTCYSTHSNKTPKCDINLNISSEEAERNGNWTIEVTNNSNDEVIGFDLKKGSDVNPAVPNFTSVYDPNCPDTRNLDLEGADTATITKGGTVTRRIFGIGNDPGRLVLRFKWHAVSVIPNTFNALKIEVFDTRGNRVSALSGSSYFSFHSNKSPKYDETFQITDANLGGSQGWKVVITNNSADEVVGFNLAKGSDVNPAVPSFRSTYKATCP